MRVSVRAFGAMHMSVFMSVSVSVYTFGRVRFRIGLRLRFGGVCDCVCVFVGVWKCAVLRVVALMRGARALEGMRVGTYACMHVRWHLHSGVSCNTAATRTHGHAYTRMHRCVHLLTAAGG